MLCFFFGEKFYILLAETEQTEPAMQLILLSGHLCSHRCQSEVGALLIGVADPLGGSQSR